MNTEIRRFILRLAVGLLAFLLGIGAAWALGGFNPFQSSSGERYYRHRHYRGLDAQPEPDFIYPTYRKRDRCRARGSLGELMPPPPPAPDMDAPMPPSPPRALR
jgi:hypothetical protein